MQILKLKDVLERTRRGKTALLEDVRAGRFPAPFKIDGKQNGWTEADVDAWLRSRMAQRAPFEPANQEERT